MNNLWRLSGLIGLALLMAGQTASAPQAGSPCASDYAPGVVLVKLRDGASMAQLQASLDVVAEIPSLGVWSLRVPAGQECDALETLRRDPRVAFAELDYVAHATDIVVPNDPGWINQWAPAKIGASTAWSIVTGTSDVVIAVLDTGVQLEHEDLAANLWTNPREIPGNWIDDDGNGKIDDVHGWNFFHSFSGSGYIPDENADVRDDNGHGTHVAGIAAAVTNNGVGVAGIAGGARIMPVKVLDQFGSGFYSDIAAGIMYAAENGARVINLSVGGAEDSQTLRAAIDYARDRGALVIAAAGNTGGPVYYPAAYEPVLAVAATDSNDQRASFSNHGPQIDVAAPGQDIYSTWCHQNIYLKLCQGSYYFTKSGTSMAAPHVSGVAALVWSHWPALTADAVAMQITQTVVDVDSPDWDEYTGWGRLDAGAAVATLTAPADLWIHITAPAFVGAGQAVPLALVYGNGGGLAASDVWITATLPASLTASTPLTHWIPSLAAASGPYTLTLMVVVSPDISAGAELTQTATISFRGVDLNPLDNAAFTVTRVEYLFFLPLALSRT